MKDGKAISKSFKYEHELAPTLLNPQSLPLTNRRRRINPEVRDSRVHSRNLPALRR